MAFPVPIGGLVLPSDFAPSIVFAILYGLLLPLVIYRIYNRRSRTILLLGTILFSVERIVIFSLRAAQSQSSSMALSNGLLKYMQISFGIGFIGIASDLVNLLRCLLVNPTFGLEKYDESPAYGTKETSFRPPVEGEEDHPKERFWLRRFSDLANLAFLAATVPGAIGASGFKASDWNDEAKANRVFSLRYASSAVALCLMVSIMLAALWSRRNQPRACHKTINMICAIASLTGVIAIYRLSMMFHKSSSLDSRAPGTLNSPGAKASFYILHVLPEWLASAILLSFNTRKIFGTGPWGDWRGDDDTPKQVEKRKAKRAAKVQAGKDAEKSSGKE